MGSRERIRAMEIQVTAVGSNTMMAMEDVLPRFPGWFFLARKRDGRALALVPCDAQVHMYVQGYEVNVTRMCVRDVWVCRPCGMAPRYEVDGGEGGWVVQ